MGLTVWTLVRTTQQELPQWREHGRKRQHIETEARTGRSQAYSSLLNTLLFVLRGFRACVPGSLSPPWPTD